LGLRALKGASLGLDDKLRVGVVARYRVPQPRLAIGLELAGLAHACLDISDGVIADFGHMAEASRVAVRIEAAAVPLSPAASRALENGAASLSELLTAGDDYELAVAAPPSARARLAALARKCKTKLTRIGTVSKGRGVTAIGRDGVPLSFAHAGFTHF
jgi:thiamine-monophosphate kinase